MKPFDLRAALAGGKVVTRNGCDVLSVKCFPEVTDGFTVCASIRVWPDKIKLAFFLPDGKFINDARQSGYDLFMKAEERKGWINIYPHRGSRPEVSAFIYDSESEANQFAAVDRVDCIPITWTE